MTAAARWDVQIPGDALSDRQTCRRTYRLRHFYEVGSNPARSQPAPSGSGEKA
jgi:hypothetical protein